MLSDPQADPDWVRRAHREELETWNAFYDVLNHLEQGLETESAGARRLSRRADDLGSDESQRLLKMKLFFRRQGQKPRSDFGGPARVGF